MTICYLGYTSVQVLPLHSGHSGEGKIMMIVMIVTRV